jgi:diguanylate cyclase
MAHKKSSTTDIALRVATAMKQMGIDGLPRNYELVYEAYAGANPDLVRDFVALGKYKTQAMLDELGRKYLPHQHEASVLQRSAGAISGEMSNFMDLLSQERTSLSDYGRLIGEASQVIRNAGGEDVLGSSLAALQRATELRVTHTAEMAEKVAAQSAVMEGIQKEMADFEAMKFVDPPTKLGNRRAFNKALARVYANPDLPMLCGPSRHLLRRPHPPGVPDQRSRRALRRPAFRLPVPDVGRGRGDTARRSAARSVPDGGVA